MVVLDILVFAIFAIFIIFGIWKGIIGTIFKISGIIAGIVLASIVYSELNHFLSTFFTFFKDNDPLSLVISYVIVLVLTIFLFIIGAKIVASILSTLKLKWLDNLVGGFFGFIVALIINSGILFGADALYVNGFYPDFKKSISKQSVLPLLNDIKDLLVSQNKFDLNTLFDTKQIKKELNNKIDNIHVKDIIPDSLKLKDLKNISDTLTTKNSNK